MDSKEFGLVFVQQLTGLEDLHYGFWDSTLPPPSLLHFKAAQNRYTEQLAETLHHHHTTPAKVLDVGCGTGEVLTYLSRLGDEVDGVIPAPHLEKRVCEKVQEGGLSSRVWGCRMENIPISRLENQYDVVLFSESFQYIPYRTSLPLAKRLLKPGGIVLICDFFKTEHAGDGQPGDKSFGGGHRYRDFLAYLEKETWHVRENTDITAETSPNIGLLDELLRQRIGPAVGTLNTYLGERHPAVLKVVKWLFRKKLAKLKFKYLSGHRTQAVFERYKTYRRMVLEPT